MSKRTDAESRENLDGISNGAPATKYQNDQQVQPTAAAEDVKTPDNGYVLQKNKTKGSELKQEAVAKVLNATAGGANPGMGISAAGSRGVSGGVDGVLGSANATPKADESRATSRYGKKFDRTATKLNFTPSEQVVNEYDESKPLADSADQDQGYNGTYRNEYARSQKTTGNTPAELLFDRSVDFIAKDQLYFAQGQYVKQANVNYKDSPEFKAVKDANGVPYYPTEPNYQNDPGDYLHRKMIVTLGSDGKVQALRFDVEDITPSAVDAETANRSAVNGAIDRNVAELDRQTMDTKAGDEKAELWSPLPRAVKDPTNVLALLRDIEGMTGDEVYVGYRKAMTSMAYQLNRAAKDGQNLTGPAIESIVGMLEDDVSSDALAGVYDELGDILGTSAGAKALNEKGSAGIMIAAYDSVNKYNTKADLLLQPRGFRMHLQTADNNMNPLHVHKRFVQAFTANETYSTIDRDYDPLLPICLTDKAALIHRRNLNQMCAFNPVIHSYKYDKSEASAFEQIPGNVPSGMTLYIHALTTDNTVGHGNFSKDATSHGIRPGAAMDDGTFVFIVNTDDTAYSTGIEIGEVTYYEHQDPFTVAPNTIQMIDVATGDGGTERNITVDHAYHGGDYSYFYKDIRNYYVVDVKHPLIQGIIDYFEKEIGAKLYTLIGSSHVLEVPMVHSTEYFSLWSWILCAATPYIVNARINSMRDVIYYQENVEYPFSQLDDIKSTSVKDFVNFTCNGYDEPLVSKVMSPVCAMKWKAPEMFWVTKQTYDTNRINSTSLVFPWYVNEQNYSISSGTPSLVKDAAAMTMPSIRSGVRAASLDAFYSMREKDIRLAYDCVVPFIPEKSVSAFVYKYGVNTDGIIGFTLSSSDAGVDADISIKEWLSQPREIGYVIDAPYGVLTAKAFNRGVDSLGWNVAAFSESATRGTSFRIKYYLGDGAVSNTYGDSSQAILKPSAVNINRAANFTQKWFKVVSNGKYPTVDHGMIFSMNRLLNDGAVTFGESSFSPFTADDATALSSVYVLSLMKAMWTRIQKLPFLISPFEGSVYANSENASTDTTFDPFEFAYYFGLCGFRASDYRESVYNREKQFVNQGYLFVNDPWIEDSPSFKEGGYASGVSVSRGFEV